MGHDDGLREKLTDWADDSRADELVDEMEQREQARAAGAEKKPGDPTPEDRQRLRDATS